MSILHESLLLMISQYGLLQEKGLLNQMVFGAFPLNIVSTCNKMNVCPFFIKGIAQGKVGTSGDHPVLSMSTSLCSAVRTSQNPVLWCFFKVRIHDDHLNTQPFSLSRGLR